MDRESMKRLRLDQRLIRRRGWISKQDLERELSALPDVSDKIRPPDPEDADEGGGVAPAGEPAAE
jgi:hypothetical protein